MMELEEYLLTLDNPARPLTASGLKMLSDLDAQQVALLRRHWPAIDSERRLLVVQELAELAEDNIDLNFRAVFAACLDDADAEVRTAAIEGLWEDESSRTLERLIALLHDPAGIVRATAAIGLSPFAYRAELGELPADTAQTLRNALLEVTADPEQPLDVRRRAVESLGYFAASPEAQAEIGRAYAHPEQLMRESAVVAMGRSMRPTWFPYIERELRSPSPALRYEAARAVGEVGEGGQQMIRSLLPLVDDDDGEVSLAAIWALGQVGGPHARRVLERLARSKDEARRQAANEALEELALGEI